MIRVCIWLIISFSFVSLTVKCGGLEESVVIHKKESSFRPVIQSDSIFSMKAKSGFVPFFFHCLGEQARAPFHMTGKQIAVAAGVIAFTAVMIQFDSEIDKMFRPITDDNKFLRNTTPQFTELGDHYGYTLVAGIAGLSLVTQQYRPLHTTMLAAQAALTSGLWVRVGKILTSRMRPGATYNDPEFHTDHWFGPFAQFNSAYSKGRGVAAFDAFPSGHTAAAFAIATIFAKEYSDYKAVPVIAYGLAGMVAISRLVQHEHWASDLVPGAAIGYLCADQVFRYDKKLRIGSTTGSVKIFPAYDQGPMLTIKWSPD